MNLLRWSGAGLIVLCLSAVFLLFNANWDMDYIIPKRSVRLAAMIIGGGCLAFSSIIFQTLTRNRILTPAIMGYESIFLLFHALLVLISGIVHSLVLPEVYKSLICASLIVLYGWLLHGWLLRRNSANLSMLLLIGIVLTMVFSTFTQLIQITISPGEFAILQGLNYTSFNQVTLSKTLVSGAIVLILCWVALKKHALLDVLLLGKDQAISLGIHYSRSVFLFATITAMLVAVSVNLIGPTAFMGVFVANITYSIFRTARHKTTLLACTVIASAVFLFSQILVEHIFNYRTTVSIIINLVCGIYFLFFLLKSKSQL